MNAFEALGLNEQLVQSVTDLGFETPTEIQVKGIPPALAGQQKRIEMLLHIMMKEASMSEK